MGGKEGEEVDWVINSLVESEGGFEEVFKKGECSKDRARTRGQGGGKVGRKVEGEEVWGLEHGFDLDYRWVWVRSNLK